MDMKKRKTKTRNENIFDTLSSSDWFNGECEIVRKSYLENGEDKLFLETEVKRLSKNLPAWESSIRNYIKTGKLKIPTIGGARVVCNQNFETGSDELYIQVYKKTTQEDVLKIWSQVEDFQRRLKEVHAPEISDINMEILKIWQEVEARADRPKIIAREVVIILEQRHQIVLEESTIRKIVSVLKRQLHVVEKTGKK
jgi:hypothetical protein